MQKVLDAIPLAVFDDRRTMPTDLMVLMAHGRIMARCAREIYQASVRQLAVEARIGDATVLAAHTRLRTAGWLDGEDRGDAFRPNSYSLKVPKALGNYQHPMVLNDTFRHQKLEHHKNLIFSLIFKYPGITVKEIAEHTDFSFKSVYNHLNKLISYSLITTTPPSQPPYIIGTIMIGEGEKPPSLVVALKTATMPASYRRTMN
jgi:hypothetical protein